MKQRMARRARKTIFLLHLWVGVLIGGWFAVMGLTGSVLAWKAEGITWELRLRSGMAKTGTPIPLSRALAAMKRADPKMTPAELSTLVPPNHSFPTYVFIYAIPNDVNQSKIALVDPYTAKVTPAFRIKDTFIGFCEYLHVRLLLGAKGTLANGVFAVFAFGLLLSGVWLWWPSTLRQWKIRLGVKRGASSARLLYDLHNVQGIYLFPLLALLTLTAVVMATETSFNAPIEKFADKLARVPPEPPPPTVKAAGRRLPVDRLMEIAETAVPRTEITYLTLPMKPDQVFTAYLSSANGGGLTPESSIALDPYTGKTVRLAKDSQSPLPHRLMAINESLHYGVWGGRLTQWLYTIAGLLPLGLFLTGVLKWLERLKRERRSRSKSDRLSGKAVLSEDLAEESSVR
jgi:uncharacterized iron-regulated membrane protein